MILPISVSRRFLGKLAAVLGLALALVSPAHADDYGCQVLLCLANPAGPTAVSECVPPITRLWDDLKHFRAFPSCDVSGSSYAKPAMSYYNPCPEGMTTLPRGSYAVQGALPQGAYEWMQPGIYAGIGSGDGLERGSDADGSAEPLPSKVCVGTKTGEGILPLFGSVGIYDKVTLLDPENSPRIIDVFVDGTLYRRVRW